MAMSICHQVGIFPLYYTQVNFKMPFMNVAPISLLIVEDEKDIADIIQLHAHAQNFTTFHAENTHQAQIHLKEHSIQLIILDWMLPGQSGIHFLASLKQQTSFKDIPVLMLTCRQDEDDKIRGFDLGAEDYLVKPFSPKELIARVKNILKRHAPKIVPEQNVYQIGAFLVDHTQQQIFVEHIESGQMVALQLPPIEFRLLRYLLENPKRLCSRDELLSKVWQDAGDIQTRTVDVCVKRLRQHITLMAGGVKAAESIQTMRGFGYRFFNE